MPGDCLRKAACIAGMQATTMKRSASIKHQEMAGTLSSANNISDSSRRFVDLVLVHTCWIRSFGKLNQSMQSGAANTRDTGERSVSIGTQSHNGKSIVMRLTYTKPTQNIDIIWIFFCKDISLSQRYQNSRIYNLYFLLPYKTT